MHWNMECMMQELVHHIPAPVVTRKAAHARWLLDQFCLAYHVFLIPPHSREVGKTSGIFIVVAEKCKFYPFWCDTYSCIITASLSLDLWLLSVRKNTVRCSWWHELIEDDRLGRNCWQRGKSTHARRPYARAPAWLGEILVAQQAGCRESWSVVLFLRKCLQVKVQTALEAHAWSAVREETLCCLPDSFECMLLGKEHLNRTF